MNTPAFIYGLVSVETSELIYVGRTVNPYMRFASHKRCMLKALAGTFEMQILEETTRQEVNDLEFFWISYMKFVGAKLLNKKYAREAIRCPERKEPTRSSCKILSLSRIMKQNGIDAVALAARSKLSKYVVFDAEKGQSISFGSIKKIAAALRVAPDRLL